MKKYLVILACLAVSGSAVAGDHHYTVQNDRFECLVGGKAPTITKGKIPDDVDKLKFTCLTYDQINNLKGEINAEPIDKEGNQVCIYSMKDSNFYLLFNNNQVDCNNEYIMIEEKIH